MTRARELAELAAAYDSGGLSNMKNRIINGNMVIDQRNAGASVTANDAVFPVDRFSFRMVASSKGTGQRSTTAPAGFINSLLFTSSAATSVGSNDFYFIDHAIEGFNVADLGWGTANAQTITLSFWVRSSLTGTFGGALRNGVNNRSYPFSYTISSANTFEYKTITIAGDTTGTWYTDNSSGLKVHFSLGMGSTYSGTAGAWAGANYASATGAVSLVGTNGATFYITGVQLEKGSTATSFDYRPYGTELALCQRYCYAIFASESSSDTYTRFGMGDCDLTTRVQTITWFPVSMRSIPSLTATAANTFTAYSAGNTFTLTAINVAPTITPKVGTTDGTTSGLTAGRAGQIIANNNRTAYLIYSAEL